MKLERYRDFRLLLQDYYNQKKTESRGFTYASFAKKANLKSPNYLKLVIDGTRNLTLSNIHEFARAMDFKGKDLDLFEALVLENQSVTALEKTFYAKRLKNLKRAASESSHNPVARKNPNSLIENATRSCLLLLSSRQTLDQAVERGKEELLLPEKTAQTILSDFIKSGSLALDPEGILRLPDRHTMISDPKGFNEKQRAFLKDGITESSGVFEERYPSGAAKFLSLIFSANAGALPDIFDELRESFEAVVQKYEPSSESPVGVYRIQMQAYRFKRNEN